MSKAKDYFKKVNVPGDGSCYFHAVSGFLEMEKLVKDGKTYYKKGDASTLRKRVVSWLRNNLDYRMPSGLTIRDDILDDVLNNRAIKDKTIQGYLTHMLEEDSYAGQIEITATANLLKRNIRVYVLDKQTYRNIGFGFQINSKAKNDIFIYHNMKRGKSDGDHFEILFPVSVAKVVSKTIYNKPKAKAKPKTKTKTKTKAKTKPKAKTKAKPKAKKTPVKAKQNKRTKRRTRRP